eukprot:CAMPEP_0197546944 /NCGR_PEP_ID=MMETSP1320-20131121/1416_1 /TAXON_ID=91990 /ORGANISM="Bolidomonas sp., Strain RCC2347" /LENGTH=225 /DNA_ID=CAMNT_0043106617 /DNA_START=493 /DNA_END=1166 /DNA_ORIENTATION=+
MSSLSPPSVSSPSMNQSNFADLDPASRAAIAAKQKAKKAAKAAKKAAKKKASEANCRPSTPSSSSSSTTTTTTTTTTLPIPTRTALTSSEYFSACPSGPIRLPLPPTVPSLLSLLSLLSLPSPQGAMLRSHQYFLFTPLTPEHSVWSPTFYASLCRHGFFVITTQTAPKRTIPLPELQPYYGVVHWPMFLSSRRVMKCLRRYGVASSSCSDSGVPSACPLTSPPP